MDEETLRQRVQEFIRSFGLLNPDHTPCGYPIPASQAHALQILGDTDSLSLQALADCLHLDKSTTSRLVTQLVQRGWVERRPNPDNRREVQVLLSATGRVARRDILTASANLYRSILSHIPAAQHAQVLDALAVLTAAVKKE